MDNSLVKWIINVGICSILCCVNLNAQLSGKLSSEDWQKDFDYLEKTIQAKHIAPYRHTDKAAFDRKFDEIRKHLEQTGSSKPNPYLMTRYIFEVIALIRDKHTYVSDRYAFFTLLPLSAYWYGQDFRITSIHEPDQDLLGAKITGINGVSIDELYELLKKVVPHSNDLGYKDAMPFYLRNPELLRGLGIIEDINQVNIKVELVNGQTLERTITPVTLKQYQALHKVNALDKTKPAPLFSQNSTKNYWFQYLKDEELLYVRYSRAANHKGEKASTFWKRLFAFADSTLIDKTVIDVRGNSGGMPDLAIPLAIELKKRPKLNRQGHLFTIIDRGTQSAAITLATMLESQTNTLMVGEGVGDRPHHLSDARLWKLPKSKIKIGLPILYYLNTHDHDSRWNISPHIPLTRAFEQYQNRHDPYLTAILNYKAESPTEPGLIPEQNYQGRYAFSKDKTLHVINEGDGLVAKLSNGWQTPLISTGGNKFRTNTIGLEFNFSSGQLHMTQGNGETMAFPRRQTGDIPAMELLNQGGLEEASKAYQALSKTDPNLIGLQRNNLSTYALLSYYSTGDFERSKSLMTTNLKLHRGIGFVNISFAKLYQVHGKGFRAFLCFATGILKGYKD